MKHLKQVEVPARTSTFVDYITCDLCGDKIIKECFNAENVSITHTVGNSYPEGGSGKETSVDMCGKCFDNKLVPWLRSQGAEPATRDWDF